MMVFRKVMLLLILLLLAACTGAPLASAPPPTPTPDPEQPLISDITISPEIVQPGQQAIITVKAVDPQQDPLVYTWSAQNGQITSGPTPQSSNSYTAPQFTVDDIVTIVVTDAEGHVARQRKYVRVVTEAQITAVTQGTPLPSPPPLAEVGDAVASALPGASDADLSSQSADPSMSASDSPRPASGQNAQGLTIRLLTNREVDPATGFSVSEQPSLEKELGELEVIVKLPDGTLYRGTSIAIYTQKIDANNQSIPGDQVANFRTDDSGRGSAAIKPGTYGVWLSELPGLPWTGLNFDKQVSAGKKLVVTVVPSQVRLVIRRADGSLLKGSYVSVSTQKTDANNEPLYDKIVRQGHIPDTGEVVFDVSPGTYVLYCDATPGEDWGVFGNYIPPATTASYSLLLGRIRIESRDEQGAVQSGFLSRVRYQSQDASNQPLAGEQVTVGRTDETGVFHHDLTAGTYVVESDAGEKFDVVVKPGHVVTLKNTDFE